jgi:hypothetical protein
MPDQKCCGYVYQVIAGEYEYAAAFLDPGLDKGFALAKVAVYHSDLFKLQLSRRAAVVDNHDRNAGGVQIVQDTTAHLTEAA